MNIQKALTIIERGIGTQFDEKCTGFLESDVQNSGTSFRTALLKLGITVILTNTERGSRSIDPMKIEYTKI